MNKTTIKILYKLAIITTIVINILAANDDADKTENADFDFDLKCGDLEKCPLTASCAETKKLCPNSMECPINGYYKCNIFTCSKFEKESCEKKVCETGVTCWDNSCADKRENCPSVISCPAEGNTRCSDNSCVTNKDECSDYKDCPNFIPFRCPNGDCRRSHKDCPQNITCPSNFKYLCNDGSCKANKGDCLKAMQETMCVDKSMTRCSDGSCTPAKFLCPTLKTCPNNPKMVLCYTGLCANSVEECFNNQQKSISGSKCPQSSQLLCPYTNSCVDHIEDCPTGTICPISRPVKCWDGSCKDSIEKCPEYMPCPQSMKECPDGSCAKMKCGTSITCARDAPYKCWDNTCKKNPLDCPEFIDCPPNKPFFCWDGSCQVKREDCLSTDSCNSNAPVKCPDNMCRTSVNECKPIDYCPIGFTYTKKGTCSKYVDEEDEKKDDFLKDKSEKDKEAEMRCPQETPIKCLDGLCMRSQSYCQATYVDNLVDSNKFRCADGNIVDNAKYCKATSICPLGKVKCQDNTCVDSIDDCYGIKSTCPLDRNFRCENGMCVKNSVDCINISGCPERYNNKCQNSGLCVKYITDCKTALKDFTLSNGCPKNLPLRCSTGQVNKCVADTNDCEIEYCPNPDTPYFCGNSGESGQCGIDMRDCANKPLGCTDQQVICPDNSCKSVLAECNSSDGCNMQTPFRCLDGSCKKYPTLWSPTKIDPESCDIGIQCPTYKPYVCADGSCVEKSHFCNSISPCPNSAPNMCFDRTCVSESCSNKVKKCPTKNPILCTNNGKCVDTIFDCFENKCPKTQPIKCASGVCTNSPQECQITSLPCEEKEFTCYDGSCRVKEKDCPKYDGCVDPKFPYKCNNGSCSKNKEGCVNDIDLTEEKDVEKRASQEKYRKILEKLSAGKILCEDGVYRKNCPSFNGCPNASPFLCTNGFCVKTISECAGISNCSLENPFRCIDGSCQKNMTDCPKIKKLQYYYPSYIFAHVGYDYKLDILVSDDNEVIGKINIPANNFTNKDLKPVISILKYKVQAKSIFSETKVDYDPTRQDDVIKVFPFGDKGETYSLEYEYSILSPIVEVFAMSETSNDIESDIIFRNAVEITLAYDFPLNKRDDDDEVFILNPSSDLCLGELNQNTNKFVCVEGEFFTSNYNFRELKGKIKKSGVYAVILSPKPDNTFLEFEENFIMKNFLILLIVFGSLLIVFAVGFYIFIRIYRYREKYKFSRENTKKIESKMQEMQNLGSAHLGQTIGDSIDNIIYTSNPYYKVEKVQDKSARYVELEGLYQKYVKRQKNLEKNNETLEKKIEMLREEIDRLNEYKRLKNEEQLNQ